MQLTKDFISDNLLLSNYERTSLDSHTKNLLQVAGIGLWSYDTEFCKLRYVGFADTIHVPGEFQYVDIPGYLSLMNDIDAQKVADYVRAMHTGYCQNSIQYKIHGNGEDFYLDNRVVSCTPKDKGYFVTGYVQNITSQVLLEQQLLIAKEKAEHSDQLKSAFLSNINHEIRTQLNAIIGFSSLIAQSDDKQAQSDYAHLVENNGQKLVRMIDELFDLAKIQLGTYELNYSPVNLDNTFNTLALDFEQQCPENVTIIKETENPFAEIVTDGKALYIVLSHLLKNALKHTSEGKIWIGYKTEDDQVTCFVQDTGTGIHKSKLEYIFENFTQIDPFTKGIGIGLSVCRTIIRELGGWIWAVSEPDKGSTFAFSLPLKK